MLQPGAESSPHAAEVWRDVIKHDLTQEMAELDTFGYTVVPPEKVAPPEFLARLTRGLLDAHERKTGVHIDDPATAGHGDDAVISTHWSLLFEDRVFEEALLNPAVYTMARVLCGRSVVLSDLLGMLKNQDPRPTHTLHTDQHGTPPPLPQYAQVCNVTWALTDYTADNGPVAVVPGSHRFGRPPRPYEAKFLSADAPVKAIPVEAPAGSLIVWHGCTWHGAFPRKSPGLRLNLIFLFARAYMKTIRDFRNETPTELVDRNPPEFADLLGVNVPYPFKGDEFPEAEKINRFIEAGTDPWA